MAGIRSIDRSLDLLKQHAGGISLWRAPAFQLLARGGRGQRRAKRWSWTDPLEPGTFPLPPSAAFFVGEDKKVASVPNSCNQSIKPMMLHIKHRTTIQKHNLKFKHHSNTQFKIQNSKFKPTNTAVQLRRARRGRPHDRPRLRAAGERGD